MIIKINREYVSVVSNKYCQPGNTTQHNHTPFYKHLPIACTPTIPTKDDDFACIIWLSGSLAKYGDQKCTTGSKLHGYEYDNGGDGIMCTEYTHLPTTHPWTT